MIREHEGEPVPGLPERLPGGETVLWQGAPRWRSLARRAFHVRVVALYFAALAVWSGASLVADGAGAGALALEALWVALVGSVPIGLLLAASVLAARTTLYTVTDRRLVLRVGIALPMAVNIPLGAVRSAGLRRCADGTGDVLLSLLPSHRVSFIALWPHVRAWRFSEPEPLLRGLPDAEKAAQALATALAASAAAAEPVQAAPAPSPAPERPRPTVDVPAQAAAA
ncbi:MAG: Putative photosynthetic complex assembly protein [uncultured Acetobacteraceae bacterium]|uniref:Photosynthetic complex assembly protein n=1 Tax=uncultured Acetobacteraceae bacterium TaxID=169975 RepID=A0A6J4JUF8_9PROT|nr:MAG: Putative photosynthetic complex assembly protein [uncultured Acetobacteraceae bacterium]